MCPALEIIIQSSRVFSSSVCISWCIPMIMHLVRQGIDWLVGSSWSTTSVYCWWSSVSALQQCVTTLTTIAILCAAGQTQLGTHQFSTDTAQADERSRQMRGTEGERTSTTATDTTRGTTGTAPDYYDIQLGTNTDTIKCPYC